MLLNIIFTITFLISFLNILRYLKSCKYSYAQTDFGFGVTAFYIEYPSHLYQTYFWFEHFGLFS